jgi:hypothetical protein
MTTSKDIERGILSALWRVFFILVVLGGLCFMGLLLYGAATA